MRLFENPQKKKKKKKKKKRINSKNADVRSDDDVLLVIVCAAVVRNNITQFFIHIDLQNKSKSTKYQCKTFWLYIDTLSHHSNVHASFDVGVYLTFEYS
jgi:hypothetical protein